MVCGVSSYLMMFLSRRAEWSPGDLAGEPPPGYFSQLEAHLCFLFI